MFSGLFSERRLLCVRLVDAVQARKSQKKQKVKAKRNNADMSL
jgi:hypothetical protein